MKITKEMYDMREELLVVVTIGLISLFAILFYGIVRPVSIFGYVFVIFLSAITGFFIFVMIDFLFKYDYFEE